MLIYSDRPLRGYAKFLCHYHSWRMKRRQYECWHYNVERDDAARLIAEGKAKLLGKSGFTCVEESYARAKLQAE